jgi:signal peptidase II
MVTASPVRTLDTMTTNAPVPWRWDGLALLVVVLDQLSKAAVLGAFQLGEGVVLTSFFNLVFVFNYGAAFSFLAGAGGWQRWFFAALAVFVAGYIANLLRRHASDRLLSTALALVMGGAIGNVIDRFRHGAVVDFLDFHAFGWHFPAFNVADSAITIGVALLFWHQLKEPAARREQHG